MQPYGAGNVFGKFVEGYMRGMDSSSRSKQERVSGLMNMAKQWADLADTSPHEAVRAKARTEWEGLMDQASKAQKETGGGWELMKKVFGKAGAKGGGAGAAQAAGPAPEVTQPEQPSGPRFVADMTPQEPQFQIPVRPTIVEGGQFAQAPAPEGRLPIPPSQTVVEGGRFVTKPTEQEMPAIGRPTRIEVPDRGAAPPMLAQGGVAAAKSAFDPTRTYALEDAGKVPEGVRPKVWEGFVMDRIKEQYAEEQKRTERAATTTETRGMIDYRLQKETEAAKKKADDWAATSYAKSLPELQRSRIYSNILAGQNVTGSLRPQEQLIQQRDPQTGLRIEIKRDPETGQELSRKELPPSAYESKVMPYFKQMGDWPKAESAFARDYFNQQKVNDAIKNAQLSNARALNESRNFALNLKKEAKEKGMDAKWAERVWREAVQFGMSMNPADPITRKRDDAAVRAAAIMYAEDWVGVSWDRVTELRRAGQPGITPDEQAEDFGSALLGEQAIKERPPAQPAARPKGTFLPVPRQ